MFSLLKKVNKVLNSKWFVIGSFAVFLYILGHFADKYYGYTTKDKTLTNICSDGCGYYAYLPQYFIYPKDKHFSFFEKVNKIHPERPNEPNWISCNGNHKVDKYYIGYAVMQSPFFLATHTIQKIVHNQTTGYSLGYRIGVTISALFYWLLGSVFLFKFLKLFSISNFNSLITVAAISFGTNLSFFTTHYSTFSHTTSYFLIASFLLLAKLVLVSNYKIKRNLLLLSVVMALICITRPPNIIIILFIPFLSNNFLDFKLRFLAILKENYKVLVFGAFFAFLIIAIQLKVTFDQIGEIRLVTYSNEWFSEWKTPHIISVLFGYNKGFFIYAPVMLLIIPGLIYVFFSNRYLFFGYVIVFSLIIYMTASWHSWDYGSGFGMRPLIDFLPLICLPIAFLFQKAKIIYYIIFSIIGISCVYVFQFYFYQIEKAIIDTNNVTEEDFWKTFMNDDDRLSWHFAYNTQVIDEQNYKKDCQFDIPIHKLKNQGLTLNSIDNITTIFPSKNNIEQIAFRLTLAAQIKLEKSNPQIVTSFYKNDSIVYSYPLLIGSEIIKKHRFESLKFDVFPLFKYSDFDSIQIKFFEKNNQETFKNPKIEFFKLK